MEIDMNAARFEGIVELHQAELYRYVRYLGARRSVAEDVVQDTFLDAYRRPGPLESADERGSAAWLRGIARNKFLKHCRATRRTPVPLSGGALEQCEAAWSRHFLRDGDGFDYIEALRGCVDKLPAKQRHAVDMQYAESKGRSAMAEALEMKADGIKSLMRRIRSALAECVERTLSRTRGETS
jgi:RNA polymerase sigma-70 factor (ECF subfamily)